MRMMSSIAEPRPHAPFVVAHRAGNHLEQLAPAISAGARLVECDVRLHRGRLEVRHLKTLGPLPVLWDRWTLANPFAPRLQLHELLKALDAHDVELMLDLKGRNPRLALGVLAALDARPVGRPVTVCARAERLLDAFSGRDGVRLVQSVGTRRGLRRLFARRARTRLGGISIHADLLDAPTVVRLREHADIVMSWPVNHPDRARTLLGWGVHGLITDTPAGIVPVLADSEARA